MKTVAAMVAVIIAEAIVGTDIKLKKASFGTLLRLRGFQIEGVILFVRL